MPPKPSKPTSKSTATKKEKLHHPESRKAGQIARKALRKGKLGNLATERKKKNLGLADFYRHFFAASSNSSAESFTLEELHGVLENWVSRHDAELEAEIQARRKGRPKSAKQANLENMKEHEVGLYKSGHEVPDLTHPPTVALLRKWDQKEVAYFLLLRFVRISSDDRTLKTVSREGEHFTVKPDPPANAAGGDGGEMDIDAADEDDEAPLLLGVPPENFAHATSMVT